MKQTYLQIAFVGFAAIAALPAFATNDIDWGEMELNKEYYCPGVENGEYTNAHGTYTAATDMVLSGINKNGGTGWVGVYKNMSDEDQMEDADGVFWDPSGVFFIKMSAGQTANFKTNMPFDAVYMTLQDASGSPEMLSVSPSEGTALSMGYDFTVTLVFDKPVAGVKANIESGSNSTTLQPVLTNSFVGLPIKTTLVNWLKSGAIKAGDPVKITVSDYYSVYDDTKTPGENIVLNYTIQELPAQIVSSENVSYSGEKIFYSYWMPGDEDGIVKITFDKELDANNPDMRVELEMGDRAYVESGAGYVEVLYPTVDGNTLVIDLTGKLRDKAAMGLTVEVPDLMGMSVMAVKDASGQFTMTNTDANLGSYGYQYTYVEKTVNLVLDPTPAANSEIAAGDEIELYLRGYEDIEFSGINFAYGTQTGAKKVAVDKSDIDVAPDPDDAEAKLLTFQVPEMPGVYEGADIVLTFADLMTADGYDHSAELTVKYKSAETEGDDPEQPGEEAEVEITNNGETITEETVLNAGTEIVVTIANVEEFTFSGVTFTSGSVSVTQTEGDGIRVIETRAEGSTVLGIEIPYMEGVNAGDIVNANFEGVEDEDLAAKLAFSFKAGEMSGVGAIFGDDAAVTVYGIDGVIVARGADTSVISTLPAGLYIANGKKIVVK